jgi:predicted esterase
VKTINPARAVPGFLTIVLFTASAWGQTDSRGRILDQVVCKADATQSYALYIPAGYTPEKKWPMILCFDPGARGRVPVELFQAAAEKYGYIVAGSLTSRNGPYAANIKAAEAIVSDLGSRLRLDPNRLYTAGLSGGARVATQLALLGLAKGVIACSAGFPDPVDGIPLRVGFPFFGTAGTEDMNQSELKHLDGVLEDRKAVHRLVIFNGGHEWAPAAVLAEGVEWLELQEMRAGTRPRDESLIRAAWQTRLVAVPASPGPERWLALKSLAADFKGLEETGGYEQKAKELGASREVKQWLKTDRALLKREDDQREELSQLALDGSPAAIRRFAAQWRQAADADEDSAERQMARRVIAGFALNARESTRALFEQAEYATAAGLLEMAAALRPGEARTYYDLARARAFDGDRKQAVEALQQAVEAGFRDNERTQAEPAFRKLAGDTAFQSLLAKMKTAPEAGPRGEGGPGR